MATKFIEKTLYVEAEFTDEVLGTSPNNKELYTDYIASKAPEGTDVKKEIEMVGVTEAVEKGTTVFLREPDDPDEDHVYISNHWLNGFLCSTAKSIRRVSGKKFISSKMAAYEQKLKTLVFVEPRMIPLELPEGAELSICQRPLRASTPQGERVALASSEAAPEGTVIRFAIELMDETHEDWIRELLDYGRYYGLGQYRNSGKGRFEWRELSEEKAKEYGLLFD